MSRGNLLQACKPPVVYHSEVEVLNEEQKAVFNTLVYSGIFDYPLKPEEIGLYLIANKPYGQQEIDDALEGLKQLGIIGEKEGLFFLRDHVDIRDLRVERQKWSEDKLIKAKKWVWLFRLIHWVQLAVVTGAVAAGNTDKDSDIDLMIIADSKRIWLTRLLILGLLKILGLRVDLKRGITANRFCVNLFIADDCLEYSPKNLYTANEIIRVKPIFERNHFYQKFLAVNQWVLGFLPNFSLRGLLAIDGQGDPSQKEDQPERLNAFNLSGLGDFFERLTRSWQVQRIRRNYSQTTDINDDELLSFQPNDCSQKILAEYEKRRL